MLHRRVFTTLGRLVHTARRRSCRCRPTSCSAAPRSSVGWRWTGCSLGCRRAATRSAWSRWGSRSARSRQPLAGPRCHGSSWSRPRLHSRSCSTPILSTLDLVAMMIGGVHSAESCCVVAFGIDLQGIEHPLAFGENWTEKVTLATGLLVGLRDRGLDVTELILVVLDGSSALRKGGRGRLGPSGHRSVPIAQDQERFRQAPAAPALAGWQEDARAFEPTVRCSPRRSSRPLRESWTRPTRGSRPASAKV